MADFFSRHSQSSDTKDSELNGCIRSCWICQYGFNGARDGKQTPGVVYSDAVEIRADFLN